MTGPTRTARDSLGELQIPAEAYYGAQTARAIANFPISGLHLPHAFVRAQAIIKWAAAKAHVELGVIDPAKAQAICAAAEEIIDGHLSEWFVVDVYQAGAGTSQNMNVNEVIAARAAELLGGTRGDTSVVHPNDDVNMSQSTNDTMHVAMQIAGMELLAHRLDPALAKLEAALTAKAREFANIVKAGRTHLQDAVPMRLGDEFGAYAQNIARHRQWLEQAAANLLDIGFGGNAVGTGINTPPGFSATAVRYVAQFTGLNFRIAANPFTFNQNPDEVVLVSGVLRNLALALQRIANDLRLLSSGPRTGLAEIELPAVQPGSSIMPGKVNPVMAEMLNMVAYQVQGCDTTVAQAGGAGQLELNVMMPVMAGNFLHEITILANACEVFADKCVAGITANEARCRMYAEHTLSLATALNVELGYDTASKIVKHALAHDMSLRDAGLALGIDEDTMARALNVEQLSRVVPRTVGANGGAAGVTGPGAAGGAAGAGAGANPSRGGSYGRPQPPAGGQWERGD
ncbi:aspartate ammonia-lyase [Alicyclobacillus cycloheptanicus]|uniref:Fumarate hydratase class II n=1 Tax=Alicyclobacillus cycloheptanicus TaxID=1457 RepID=A0ABT9XKR7_9BACL|nr:aspartate ammonia-lyase [Alicyclobacillus cycloheptanicus]MDQ0190897.1 fumarate hydratase class II [Alicyclobacillus cycloheptanicus]WDM01783.1 aspartate ammonia-lyase [Alicyclobacillus cycloheptanicus]